MYKCGNHALNSRLINKSVTEIVLIDTNPHSTSRWPRCLSQFALERLSINRGHAGPLGTSITLQNELKKLSASLKSLDIVGRGVAIALFSSPAQFISNVSESDDEATEPPPSKRPKLAEADGDQLHHELWNLDITWPHMERLSIEGECRDSDFGSTIFGRLPRSLTWFSFKDTFLRSGYPDLSSLPSGLETLHLADWSIQTVKALKTLPKSLTNLGGSLAKAPLIELFHNSDILPNLNEFPNEYHYPLSGDKIVSLFETYGHCWPESMRTLAISRTYSHTKLKTFPSKLVTLDICNLLTPITPTFIAQLPRTLESLTLSRFLWDGLRVSDWPNLKHLHIENVFSFGAHYFSLLPRSLTKFEVDLGPYHLNDQPAADALRELHDSKSIEELQEIGRESLKLDHERWSSAKAMLLTPYYVALGSEAYIKRVEAGELFGLPLGLVCVPTDAVSVRHLPLLPPYTQAHAVHLMDLENPKLLAYFPPSDTMHLSTSLYFEGREPRVLPSECALYQSNLHSLNVAYFPAEIMRHSCLEYLPRSLCNLNFQNQLGTSHPVRPSELPYLPPKLQKLELSYVSTSPDELWLHLLPATLTWLKVLAPIYGPDLINLPPKLEHLSADFFSVTLLQARQVPSTLRTIEVSASESRHCSTR